MTFYRDYSPNGYDRAVRLFKEGYYDESHFFRVVPKFLVQFGISYTTDPQLKSLGQKPIADDPVIKAIKFEPGTISFAGHGRHSRTSHLFISLMKSTQFGTNPWETPIGFVTKGMDVIQKLDSTYGDMPPWGKGPEQTPIYDGPKYIEENFPLLDKFKKCKVETMYTDQSNIPPTNRPGTYGGGSSHHDEETYYDSDEEEYDSDEDYISIGDSDEEDEVVEDSYSDTDDDDSDEDEGGDEL